ncbi:hypothetical protein [Streptomyces sp. SAS_276]|uniref:hypothetical protein n=1 Tax=Streptomyces sp. SAS_276 TaxID=3412745 RepID=UPI00403D49E0
MKFQKMFTGGGAGQRRQLLGELLEPGGFLHDRASVDTPTARPCPRPMAAPLIWLLEAVPPVRGKRGRPWGCPDGVPTDRGCDHDKYGRLVRDLGVKLVIT